jgi:hypothetical protein
MLHKVGDLSEAVTVKPKLSNNAISVDVANKDSDIVDVFMCTTKNMGNLLALDTSVEDTLITLTAGHGTIIGDTISLKEGICYYQGLATNVVGNDITLDTPLDHAFTAATTTVCIGNINLAQNGSLVSPIIAFASPPNSTIWDVTRILFTIQDNVVMDNGKFGGIAALTNGIVLRKKDSIYKNIFNVKTNGDFAERAYDIAYDSKAPAGEYGFRCRRTFGGAEKNGSVIRLHGAGNDEIQIIIQDDLSALTHLHAVIQGHVFFS